MTFMSVISGLISLLAVAFGIAIYVAFFYILILAIKALRKYIKSSDVKKSPINKSLGEAIKEHRTKHKMTQEFVAESLGVSRQAVSKWENGTSDPSTSNLFALAKLFGISVGELLEEVEDKTK